MHAKSGFGPERLLLAGMTAVAIATCHHGNQRVSFALVCHPADGNGDEQLPGQGKFDRAT
jgi:hypothetical protein